MSVLIDSDPTLGRPFSDIDDVLAIVFAQAAGVEIAAVTSVWGNASIGHTTAIAERITRRFGLPSHRGASGPGDSDTPAARALARHTGTVVALGPLTNVAAALDLGARWERLVVLGGTTSDRLNLRPLHTTEFNLAVDRQAAFRVLPHATDVVLMEPCRQVWFGRAHLAPLPSSLRRRMLPWWATSVLRHGRFGFHPWDVLAVALLTHPHLFHTTRSGLTLDRSRCRAGRVILGEGSVCVARGVDANLLHSVWFDVIRAAASYV